MLLSSQIGITETRQKWYYTRPVYHDTVEQQDERLLHLSEREEALQ
jgi:hypothetical protein